MIIKISQLAIAICVDETNNSHTKPITNAVKSINAGDDFADVVMGRLKTALPTVLDGLWMDFNSLDAIDLTKSYWDQCHISAASFLP